MLPWPCPVFLRLFWPFAFSSPSGIWFPTSLHDGQWYSLRFSVFSLLQRRDFFSSDDQRSHNLFCTHPPSTTSSLGILRALSVHDSLVFLRSIAWIGSGQTPSFNSSHSCLTTYFFQSTILACFRSILTSCWQTTHVHLCPRSAKCATLATGCPGHEFRT